MRPARLTGPNPFSSASPALRSRSESGSAQWVTGKRPPNGSIPAPEAAKFFRGGGGTACSASWGPPAPPLGLASARPEQVGPDQPVEVAVHHRLDVADLEPRPVVLDELVGMKRVRADLTAEGDLLLLAGELVELLALLLLRQLVEPRFENSHRRVAVAKLRALVLALDDDARRQVRDADGRVGGVDPLAAGTGGAGDVHPDLILPQVHLHVVHLRHDRDRREARLPAARGVERRDPDEPVHARLALEGAVGVLARDLDRRGLDPRLVAGEEGDDLRPYTPALTPAKVHPEQHLRPILGLRAAGARMDREDRGLGVVGARHHDLQLELVEILAEAHDAGGDLGVETPIVRLGRELEEHGEVLGAGGQLLQPADAPAELRALPDELLGAAVVLPERGRRHLCVERSEPPFPRGDVKDAPGARSPAWRGRRRHA